MKPDNNQKTGYSRGIISTIEKINDYVYYSSLAIPHFICNEMTDCIPEDYLTARAIDLAQCEPVLRFCTERELERVATAKSLKRQVEWFCGRIALKDLLRSVMFPDLDYHDIVINYDSSGRPCIAGHKNTGLSVTHSGDVAMAALHTVPGKHIGIDTEKAGPLDAEAVLAVAFSREEREFYKDRAVNEIISAFTMKEAYLKFTGQGFHEVITKITVKNGVIFHEGNEVPGIYTVTRSYKNEYVTSIIFEL